MNECCCKSKFWIGMGLGAVVGAVCCHLAHTQKAKELRGQMNDIIQRVGDKAQAMCQSAHEKMMPENERCPECDGE